jgi:hypothetical protein
MKKKLSISFSGGRTSAFMTKWCLDNLSDKYEMIVTFANTGKEREETFEFIQECDRRWNFNVVWLEAIINPISGKGTRAKVVNFNMAKRNGEPFESMIAKYGIPHVGRPYCTRELKAYTMRSYLSSIGWKKDYETAVGIRVDEFDRISESAKKERLIYPLISKIPTTKEDINRFWSKQDFDLKLKSYEGNCDLCFKKSFRKLMTIVKENPEFTGWWKDMEGKYENYIPESQSHNNFIIPPIHFFRSNKSMLDVINMSKNKFELAKDESKIFSEYKQGNLWGVELDISNGCSESCEVF